MSLFRTGHTLHFYALVGAGAWRYTGTAFHRDHSVEPWLRAQHIRYRLGKGSYREGMTKVFTRPYLVREIADIIDIPDDRDAVWFRLNFVTAAVVETDLCVPFARAPRGKRNR